MDRHIEIQTSNVAAFEDEVTSILEDYDRVTRVDHDGEQTWTLHLSGCSENDAESLMLDILEEAAESEPEREDYLDRFLTALRIVKPQDG